MVKTQARKPNDTPVPRFLVDRLVRSASSLWHIPLAHVTSTRRFQTHVEPRFAVYAVLHAEGFCSGAIAAAMNGVHHNTVLHGIQRARHLAAIDASYSIRLEDLQASIQRAGGEK